MSKPSKNLKELRRQYKRELERRQVEALERIAGTLAQIGNQLIIEATRKAKRGT